MGDRLRAHKLLVCLAALLFVPYAVAQEKVPPEELTIRTTTRLVVIDAIVTDSKSQPVSGLKPSDFTVLDDGKPQKLAFFSYESPERAKTPPKLPPLRPGVYTNIPEFHTPPGPMVILLLDGLNTPPDQQIYARKQMLKYLADAKLSGPGTAVLALGNDLTVLQDFTTDSRLLTAAVQNYLGGRTAHDVEAPKIDMPVTTGPSGGGAPAAAIPDSGSGDIAASISSQTRPTNSFMELAESLKRFDNRIAVEDQDQRTRKTLEALRTIGRAVAGYSGRKSLLWFSAGFPFTLSLNDSMDLEFSKNYRDEIRQASALLANANVAVYPIETQGLASAGGLSDVTRPISAGAPSTSLAAETFNRYSSQETSDSLAYDTGGRVFRNTNDLTGALKAAVKDSESYYILGFYPSSKKWDGKFHSLKLQLADKQLKARARTGYFAVDPADWKKGEPSKELISADIIHTLSATGVLFYSHAMVPDKKNLPVTVEIIVDPKTISFGDGPEATYTTSLDFQVGAFSPEGKLVKIESKAAEANLQRSTYENFMKRGIPVSIDIKLDPGRYLLRVAARDNRNGHVGTLDMPLILEDKAADSKTAAAK